MGYTMFMQCTKYNVEMTDESERGGEISIGKEIEGMIERAGEACQAGSR